MGWAFNTVLELASRLFRLTRGFDADPYDGAVISEHMQLTTWENGDRGLFLPPRHSTNIPTAKWSLLRLRQMIHRINYISRYNIYTLILIFQPNRPPPILNTEGDFPSSSPRTSAPHRS
jgi:hypothetical protein